MSRALTFLAVFFTLLSVTRGMPIVDGKADLKIAKQALEKQGSYGTYLKLLKSSGFEPILARYIETQPVSLLVPTDDAFAALPLRVKSQLAGSRLIKLLELHMLLHKLPVEFLRRSPPSALVRTVYGTSLTKLKSALANTVILAPASAKLPSDFAVITKGNIAAAKLVLLCVHGVNNVMIPRGDFF